MSVLIKGMEMPNCCQNCSMGVTSDGGYYIDCVLTEKSILDPIWPELRNRPDWCPFVEVLTPHGTLVDLNLLISNGVIDDSDLHNIPTLGVIQNATVIESEE